MAKALYTLEVTITEGSMTDEFVRGNPVVSRTIEIRADQTLNQLHRIIFEAFGRWDDCHLSQFNLGAGIMDRSGDRYVLPFIFADPERYEETSAAGSTTQTRIGGLGLQVGRVFWYEYDYGDEWQHRIEVVAIGEAVPKAKYPRVTARVGESPPQYREWDEDGEAEEAPPEDWLAEVLDGCPGVGDQDVGTAPLEEGEVVTWIRQSIPVDLSWDVRGAASRRTYRVTTITPLTDGTSIIATYLVPGFYLGFWLERLWEPSEEPEVILSVELA